MCSCQDATQGIQVSAGNYASWSSSGQTGNRSAGSSSLNSKGESLHLGSNWLFYQMGRDISGARPDCGNLSWENPQRGYCQVWLSTGSTQWPGTKLRSSPSCAVYWRFWKLVPHRVIRVAMVKSSVSIGPWSKWSKPIWRANSETGTVI